MSAQITRKLRPEEEELLHKRDELTAIRLTLTERELELADFRRQLAVFEGLYLRQVGVLYAELDEWKARLAELRARLSPSKGADEHAHEARANASQAYEEAHGEASETQDFAPSPELRSLFREVAKRIHPDLCKDAADLERRTRLMAEANRAYETGDADRLRQILDDFHDGADAVEGEGVGAELVRLIRQISQVKNRLTAIDQEFARLAQSEIARLKKQAEEQQRSGQDLLVELATSIKQQIERAQKEYEDFARRAGHSS